METIDYRINDKGYTLTVAGRKIGEVFEKEHAELIARVTNKNIVDQLETQVENFRLENEKLNSEIAHLKQAVEAYRMTLQKVNSLSSITKLAGA